MDILQSAPPGRILPVQNKIRRGECDMTTKARTPVIIGVIALIWNLMGLAALLMDAFASESARAAMTEAQRALADATPIWAVAGSTVAVLTGCAGSMALILRQRWAVPAFLVSLIGLCVQNFWLFSLSDAGKAYGQTPFILQGMVFIIAGALWAYAKLAAGRGDIS
jgi:hypothetical protein